EVSRVLKPGGTVVITDVDDKVGSIFEPEWPVADALWARVTAWQAQKGGNRLIGRKLWRMLATTGYRELELEAVLAHSDKLGAENMILLEWDPGAWQPLLDAGLITEEDLETIHQEHVRFHAAPDKYVLFALLMAKGEKPKE